MTIPGMFINSMPKSGSMYIWKSLSSGLGVPCVRISLSHFVKHDCVVEKWARRFSKEANQIAQQHLPPARHNLALLKQCGIDRIVVHLRDPRQIVVSRLLYYENVDVSKGDIELALLDMEVPFEDPYDEYMSLSFEEKINCHIKYSLPMLVSWILGWVKVAEDTRSGFRILLTRFEDMKSNPSSFFGSILKFYDVDETFWRQPDYRPKEHFRKGAIDEWREVLSPVQIENCNEIIPPWLFEKFVWKIIKRYWH